MRSTLFTAISAALALSGCAAMQPPENLEAVDEGKAYQAQYRSADADRRAERNARSIAMNAQQCSQAPITSAVSETVWTFSPESLSPGDLVAVAVGSDDVFSGSFEISADGVLRLPHLNGVTALGRRASELETEIAQRLVREGFYRRAPRISVRLADRAPARVFVAGAVFEAGQYNVGGVSGDDRDLTRQDALGDGNSGRTLSTALRSAGGVRPDADLSRVRLARGGKTRVLDMSGAIDGRAFEDVSLISGDRIEVPSRGCFQERLMVPNAISPPGISVYMSNLTKPADANALSAIGKETREMPYGTRFLQAVVKMNCAGGTQVTNADRYAVLFSRNPITGTSVLIERRVEDLLRRADRDELDPFLLPGDAIACYDSTVTNITEVAKSIAIVLGTGVLLAI